MSSIDGPVESNVLDELLPAFYLDDILDECVYDLQETMAKKKAYI